MNHTNKPSTRFDAYDVALDIIRQLAPLMPRIKARDRALEKQIREAANSISMNVAEGWRRLGKDRRYHYAVAAGSADEVRAGLDNAEAWGHVPREAIEEALVLLDRELAMLYRLTH